MTATRRVRNDALVTPIMTTTAFPHQVIRASAGSGKTYKLSERYLLLLLAGAPVDSILATTFTRKAAGEIQDRILARLGSGALDEQGARRLSQELYGNPEAISRERLCDLAYEVAHSLHRLRVCTLDSFFMQIAGNFAFEIGLPPGWRIVEDVDYRQLLRRAIQASFMQTKTESAVQLARLLFKGETPRSMESEITSLVNDAFELYFETKPQDWTQLDSLVTCSRSELDELLQESIRLFNEAPAPVNKKGELNLRFLKAREKIIQFALDNNTSGFFNETIIKNVLDGKFTYSQQKLDEETIAPAVNGLVKCLTQRAFIDGSNYSKASWIALDSIAKFFTKFKTEEGSYRFEDLTRTLVDLELNQLLQQIVYRLDAKTSHMLLDEFQDASFAQWTILKPFAESITSRAAQINSAEETTRREPAPSFFCVGDVKQAIYGWRGGVAEIFSEIERALPNIQTVEMSRNWRSCPTIIDVANSFFGKLMDNPALSLKELSTFPPFEQIKKKAIHDGAKTWLERYSDHLVAEKNQGKPGYWALEAAPRVLADVIPSPQLPPINLAKGQTEPETSLNQETVRYVNRELEEFEEIDDDFEQENPTADYSGASKRKLQKLATVLYTVERIIQLREQYPDASIGVLTRSNKRLALIIAELKRRHIDASEEGGAPLIDSPAVGAVLSMLELASQPGNTAALFHIANLEPLAKRLRLPDPKALQPGAAPFVQYKRKSVAQRVSLFVRNYIDTLGLGAFVADMRRELLPMCDTDASRERLEKLVEFAYSYQQSSPIIQLEQFIRAVRDKKVESPSSAKLRVMTLHKSKGLEFDIVVLPELNLNTTLLSERFYARRETPVKRADAVLPRFSQTLWPHLPKEFSKVFSDAVKSQTEEALCLLYVAITRPVRMLVAIIDPPSLTSKATPFNFAYLLQNTLADKIVPISPNSQYGEHPQILFEVGVKDWNRAEREQEPPERPMTPPQRPLAKPLALSPQEQRVNPEPFRPMRLLLHRETPTGGRNVRRWSPDSSFQPGTAIHAAFELIRWLDVDGMPSDDAILEIIGAILMDDTHTSETFARFKQICESPLTQRLLSLSTYRSPSRERPAFERVASCVEAPFVPGNYSWEVWRERPFSQLVDRTRLWRGTIDRLVLLMDGARVIGADVIDFKSDRFYDSEGRQVDSNGAPLPPPAETLAEYQKQLSYYGQVVQRQYRLPSEAVSLRLAFVSQGYILDARAPQSSRSN
ncbi:MAG: UvrD-helicase domain-containing protein [Planctomycetia bacterium]|nr:UvrD-helicase domain-containing protein [Planctomycetia bacterium]